VFVGDSLLAIAEDGGLELHRAGFVGTVDVAEGGGKQETAQRLEGFIDGEHVLRGGVELVGRGAGGVVAVLFATNDAGFHLEDDAQLSTFLEEFFGKFHVVGQWQFRGIQHVALEQGALALGDALARGVKQRAQE